MNTPAVQTELSQIATVLFYALVALVVSLFARWIARGILVLYRLLPDQRAMTPDRRRTLEGLFSSLVSLLAFIVAGLATLSLFLRPETLFWVVGLFSAAFGMAARGLVADILAGSRFLFRNTFAIGEKVEMMAGATAVEGTVEEVNITNTLIRSPNGELCVVPNGDIGVIRNFSRAPFSAARIRFWVRSGRLAETLDVIGRLGQQAPALLPELTEPWQVISTSEAMSTKSEVTVVAHTSFAKAAALRLQMIRLIDQRLREAGIELLD